MPVSRGAVTFAHLGCVRGSAVAVAALGGLGFGDGSQFTTGGAENPTLTIVSLAVRQADYIAEQMSQKAI